MRKKWKKRKCFVSKSQTFTLLVAGTKIDPNFRTNICSFFLFCFFSKLGEKTTFCQLVFFLDGILSKKHMNFWFDALPAF